MTKSENRFFYLANDTTFKYLFKNPKSRGFFEELIKYYTGLDINDFEFIDNELPSGNSYVNYRLDRILSNSDKSIILNVELNREYKDYVELRDRKYLHTIAGSSDNSKDYNKDRVVIQLNLNCYLSKDNKNICTSTYMLKDDKNDLVIEDFKIHNVFIPMEVESCYNKDIKKKLELFLCDSYEKMRSVAEDDKELKIIVDEIERLNKDKFFGALYDAEEEQKKLENSARNSGFKEGHDVGIQEGYSLRNEEIAKSLIEENVDIEIISKTTGLSIEEINNL